MHLLDVISPDEEDEAILLEHSKYFDDLSFKNTLCKQNGKISILSLNCQSINAKFDKLNFFIDYINDHIPISVICIQESWGHEEIDMRLFTLPNYKMVNQNRRLIGYEPAGLTVHPPPQNDRGWVHFFRIGV